MSEYFDVVDLALAGLGADIGGAYLLARGLITSPANLTRTAMSFWDSNRFLAVTVAKDRIDAISGITALAVGFALQATAYVVALARPPSDEPRWTLTVTASLIMLGSLVLVLVLGWLHRWLRLVPTLVEMSHYTATERRDLPRATLLPGWLEAAGLSRKPGEDALTFVRRSAGVENMVVEVAGERTRLWTDPPLEGE